MDNIFEKNSWCTPTFSVLKTSYGTEGTPGTTTDGLGGSASG